MSSASTIRFPQLRRVALQSFSLYTQKPTVDLLIPPGVLCLAGANGLGKSTFLAAVNYAITGVVPLPSRSLKSAAEYYSDALRFTKDYFTGRIDIQDRESAAISVEFSVGETTFALTRGVFDVSALRDLTIVGRHGGNFASHSPEDRHRRYTEIAAKEIGLPTFDQFVFLQHFVLTFDESRNLLFWDERALNQAIYLSFGGDYAEAVRAETIRREMERFDSRVRNLQFQASGVMKRIRDVEKALGINDDGDHDEIAAQWDGMQRARSERLRQIERAELSLGDLELKRAELAAEVVSLRTEYATEFGRHLQSHSGPESHPLIRELLVTSKCGVCGTQGVDVTTHVKNRLAASHCPLCDSQVIASNGRSSVDFLKELDLKLAHAKEKLNQAAEEAERVARGIREANAELSAFDDQIKQFEEENSRLIDHLRTKETILSGEIAKSMERMREEYKTLRAKRQDALNSRNAKRQELTTIRGKVERGYAAAEEHFVPLFQNLAELFLGMELDVRLEARATTDVVLVVEIRRTQRRQQHQLSESQRFFVDIALRMAFAQYLSEADSPAALFIDTPEGSLDIAYERNAGAMFANFVLGGHDLIMTANINTSRLLLALARECGKDYMTLHRMTSWTDLSEVQLRDESEFEEAYDAIERAMVGSNG